jgi:hypothetical protein
VVFFSCVKFPLAALAVAFCWPWRGRRQIHFVIDNDILVWFDLIIGTLRYHALCYIVFFEIFSYLHNLASILSLCPCPLHPQPVLICIIN